MTRYEDRTAEELRKLAADREIPGRSSMSKDELIAALRGESEPESEPEPAPDEAPSGPFALPPEQDSVVGPGAVPLESRG